MVGGRMAGWVWRHLKGGRPKGCLLLTRPSLAIGNVILSCFFFVYSKSEIQISDWKHSFSDPIILAGMGSCVPALLYLRWNIYISERMGGVKLKLSCCWALVHMWLSVPYWQICLGSIRLLSQSWISLLKWGERGLIIVYQTKCFRII